MDRGAWYHGVAKSQTLSDFTFTFHFPALEKEMATHSSVLVWRIPGMGEPGGLLSMGLHRVRHDWSDLAAAAAAEPMSQKSSVICLSIPSSPCQPETVTHWAAFNGFPCSSQSFSLKHSPQGEGTLLYCWWECIWCSCNGTQCGGSSKN